MSGFNLNQDEQDDDDKVLINVGGIKFETYVTTLQKIADTRLTWLTENIDADILRSKKVFFKRHPGAFVHILNCYRTGKLHTPTDICGPLFEEELQFWGIDKKQMEPCCGESFTKHTEFHTIFTSPKLKFSVKDFFNKCDQIQNQNQIWSHLLKKFLMENFIFWA